LVERDYRKFESLANSILGIDSKIISLMIVSIRTGSTLAEIARPDQRNTFGSISERSNGMAGKWEILAFNSMERLEPTKSKSKYLTFVTEIYTEIVFPTFLGEDLMLGVIVEPGTDALSIYRLLKLFLGEKANTETISPISKTGF
jgi:hypothetical protein